MSAPVNIEAGVRELQRRGLLTGDAICAFVVGSVARGWGNATSDVDLYLVVGDRWVSPAAEYERTGDGEADLALDTALVDGRQWDLKYWPESRITEAIDEVSWSRVTAGEEQNQRADLRRRDLLERLLHALPVSGTQAFTERILRPLRASALLPVLTARALNISDTYVEDAVGQLAADDPDNAVLSARSAFDFSIEALLTAHGEPGYRAKWRPNRFRAAEQSVVSYQEYWNTETMRDLLPGSPHTWVTGVIRLCQRIAMEVNVDARLR